MKKVLVTGATGFIGNFVIETLLQRPVEIIASSSNKQKASEKNWFKKVKYIPLDFRSINETEDYYSFFGKPDLLIHLTWEGLPNYKSSFHVEANFPRHKIFLKSLIKGGVTDITVTGTCFEYGLQEGALKEEMPTFPENPYGEAKDNLRKELEHLKNEIRFDLKWVRLFYMYGQGQHANSLLSQLEKALALGEEGFNMSGGEQVRDFMPIEEVASSLVMIALQNQVTGIINCCSGTPESVKDFVLRYLKRNQKEIRLNLGYYPYPDYEPMAFWGDNTKLKTILNNEQSNSSI